MGVHSGVHGCCNVAMLWCCLMLAWIKTTFLESESKILYWSPGDNNIISNKRHWMFSFSQKSSNIVGSRGLAASSETFWAPRLKKSSNTVLMMSEVFFGWLDDLFNTKGLNMTWTWSSPSLLKRCTEMLRYRFELKNRLQWHVKV